MKALGGTITVQSEVGKGSTFICKLTVTKKPEPEQEEQSFRDLLPERDVKYTGFDTPRLSVGGNHDTCINFEHLDINFESREICNQKTILIVDDQYFNVFTLSQIIKTFIGIESDTAYSGEEAIQKIKDNGKYDMIFMDI